LNVLYYVPLKRETGFYWTNSHVSLLGLSSRGMLFLIDSSRKILSYGDSV